MTMLASRIVRTSFDRSFACAFARKDWEGPSAAAAFGFGDRVPALLLPALPFVDGLRAGEPVCSALSASFAA